MTAANLISLKIPWNRAGTPGYPVLVDARTDGDVAAAAGPARIPSAVRRSPAISKSRLNLRYGTGERPCHER